MLTTDAVLPRFHARCTTSGTGWCFQAADAQETTLTARHEAIADIAGHRVGKTQDYLEAAGADIYGQYVFHEAAQRQYLAKPIFEKLRRTIEGHEPFDRGIVDAVAHGVKEWALAHGATH